MENTKEKEETLVNLIFSHNESKEARIATTAYETKIIEISNGTKVAYYELGDATNQTIIFIHGFTGNKGFWSNIVKEFEANYHIIAIDMIGHGETVLSESEYLNDWAFAEQLQGVLAAFGKEKYIVMGHSLGGLFIEQYIIKYGCDKLSCIALMDSAPSLNAPEGFPFPPAGGFGSKAWMMQKDFGDIYNWQFFIGVANSKDPKGFETVTLHACQNDQRSAFGKINVPTLYLYPDKDIATMTNPLGMIEWLKEHSDPRYVTFTAIDSSSHLFPVEQQAETVAELKKLLAKINN